MQDEAFRTQPHTRAQGQLGEDAAVEWLQQQRGYRILDRNVTSRVGELDVVAIDGETLCFVEIKARSSKTYGAAVEAVTAAKQRRVARAASLYLARRPFEGPCRFDVLALDSEDDGWRYTLVQDAFSLAG
ncbi:MAG: YraN family protein [Acidobacteriota bacterium]